MNIDFCSVSQVAAAQAADLKIIIPRPTSILTFSKHFNDAPIINVSGRSYPVEIRYRAVELDEEDETAVDEQAAILGAVDELWRAQAGDILVFLSGEREIRETAESLRKHHPQGCEVLPLYSRLSQDEQQRVFKLSGRRRVVLATNVAETSLTVPGIRAVIDTGVARISRYSHRSRLQRLPIEKISRASANQRSGRCGRVGPGVAIRLYSEQTSWRARNSPSRKSAHQSRRRDPADACLSSVTSVTFRSSNPGCRLVRDGHARCVNGALSEEVELTDAGGGSPNYAGSEARAHVAVGARNIASMKSPSSLRAFRSDPRDRPADKQTQADQKHAPFRDEQSDFLSLLKLWRAWCEQREKLSRAKLRGWCKENFLSYVRLTEWHDVHGQVMEVVKGELALKMNAQPGQYASIHRALLAGLLSQVAERKEQGVPGSEWRQVHIHPGSGQFHGQAARIVSAETVGPPGVPRAQSQRSTPPGWSGGRAHDEAHHYNRTGASRFTRRDLERRDAVRADAVSGRSVPYERVDAKAAREMFIRHALVLMEYDSRTRRSWRTHQLLEELEYLQQKGRASTCWGVRTSCSNFSTRVCRGNFTGAAFERWRRRAEAKDPQILGA